MGHMSVYALGDLAPSIDPSAFVHPDAVVIGDVHIGPESSIWPCAVLRGDHGSIRIGARTSIQDGTVVHTTSAAPTIIGDDCVIGHNAHLEGCTVHDGALVGSGSVVLHHAVIGAGALVGAAAMVPNDTDVPPLARALGVPVRVTPDAVAPGAFAASAARYVASGRRYLAELRRLS